MKILFINPPMQVGRSVNFPPHGLFYVSHAAGIKGYDTEILEIDGHGYSKEKSSELIKNSRADVYGIGGLVTVYPYLYWLIPEIRKINPTAKIILGGAVASSLRERCFQKFDIDFEVIGEGEVTIVELLNEIKSTHNYASVKGIGYRNKDGAVVYTENRPLMESLDAVPMFNDELFPMETYLQNKGRVIQIHAQRGCPCSCTFCFNCYRVVSGKVRYRPVKNILDEVEYNKNKYKDKVKLFAIMGECITMNKQWLLEFCKEICKRKLKIKYRVSSRVDTIDEEKLYWLKKSGCVNMSLGLESGSEKILKIMKKGTSVEKNKQAVAISNKYIKKVDVSIILGYIGETHETMAETVKLTQEILTKEIPQTFFATPFPGTELYRMALEKNFIKDEEKYLLSLDKIFIDEKSINLTEMSDDEAKKMVHKARRDIVIYYYYHKPWLAFAQLKNDLLNLGVKKSIEKIYSKMISN